VLLAGCARTDRGTVVAGVQGTDLPADTTPVPTSHPPLAVRAGWKLISYHGVQVQVPDGWAVSDGNHAPFCGDGFTVPPTAFVGPRLSDGAPSCPGPPPGTGPDTGLWILPGAPDPSYHTTTATNRAGTTLVSMPAAYSVPATILWVDSVEIILGPGPDPQTVGAIIDSITLSPGAPDSATPDRCEVNPAPDVMPTPERQSGTLTVDGGRDTLGPLEPGDDATATPEEVWARSGGQHSPLERYRLILTRYSSQLPLGPGGGYAPQFGPIVSWVIYATPITHLCGMSSLSRYDATSGDDLGGSAWGDPP
jgi:hypothetical protein